MRTLAKAAVLTRILMAVSRRARAYVQDPVKMQKLVVNADERAAVVGEAGSMARQALGYVSLMGRLGSAFVRREYRAIPWGTVVGATAAVLYFVMPIDFVPDFFVGLGMVDDAALIAFVASQIRGDLDKFSLWERSRHGRAASAPVTVDGVATPLGDEQAMGSAVQDAAAEPATEAGDEISDATLRRAADAVVEAVEEAQQQHAQQAEEIHDGRKAAKAAERAAKEAAKESERAAGEAEKAARKAGKSRRKAGGE